jgi:hypothetical protein
MEGPRRVLTPMGAERELSANLDFTEAPLKGQLSLIYAPPQSAR